MSLPVARADDRLLRVTWTEDAKTNRTIDGKLVVEAQDGGLLLLGRDGRLWTITPEQIEQREERGEVFTPLTAEELGQQLKAELGGGFEIVTTRHYVICSNAGRVYAEWCGALFERLFAAFHTYWKTSGLDLQEPQFPLAAIVFATPRQFAEFAAREAGTDAAGAVGYYSARTNRMVLHDLTAGPNSRPATTHAEIERRIQAVPFNVATVVHEATHQIAFNTGPHTRFADNPLWLTEGLAMFFETPDLHSRNGWRTVGKVNPPRMKQFQDYARQRRPADSLRTLLESNARFADAETAADAYAEGWALTYFLLKTHRQQYVAYVRTLSRKPPLVWDEPPDRLKEFTSAFGDLNPLDQDFRKYLQRASSARP